eukprot:3158161-Amphidinium_carterae.1
MANTVFGLRPPRSQRTVETSFTVAKSSMLHHQYEGCLILGALCNYRWARLCYKDQTCTAHIYDKRQSHEARNLDIGIDDPQNTFRFLHHIELEFDKGKLMILPYGTETGTVGDEQTYFYQVHVQNALQNQAVLEVAQRATYESALIYGPPVRLPSGRNLEFQHLDKLVFKAGRVYMRCLFEKA